MGFLLLFDVTNESSFLSVREWLTNIETFTRVDNELRPPILLVGNKIDLVTHRSIDTIRAQQLANDLNVTYIETSAVTGTNVQEALTILITQIFDFMEKSMEKYYKKTSVTFRLTAAQTGLPVKSPMKIIEKFSRVKTKSCACT